MVSEIMRLWQVEEESDGEDVVVLMWISYKSPLISRSFQESSSPQYFVNHTGYHEVPPHQSLSHLDTAQIILLGAKQLHETRPFLLVIGYRPAYHV